MNNYSDFLATKRITAPSAGFSVKLADLTESLFPHQKAIIGWALRRGKSAVFADTGLGKSAMEIEWAWRVHCHTEGGNVMIITPLAVAAQMAKEGARIGIPVTVCRSQADVQNGVNVANYERLHLFDCSQFAGIVADESSILKSHDGATRQAIQEFSARIPYRMAATATPAPNDVMELGTHAEFLGVMSRVEMLATFFCHDGGDTSKWRLKGHAESAFWQWVATWAVACKNPSDLGFDGSAYILPEMTITEHTVDAPCEALEGTLFTPEAVTLTEQRAARKSSLTARVDALAATVAAEPSESWLLWCDLNAEGDAMTAAIPGAVQLSGSDTTETKERILADFADGRIKILVSKPSICGFGLNFQICARMAFVGVTHSYEAMYQAIRRCHRFGQTRPVNVHLFFAETEQAVVRNLRRKEREAELMTKEMVSHMSVHSDLVSDVSGERQTEEYGLNTITGKRFDANMGDCVEIMRSKPEGCMDYMVYSPPFASLYTYSNSERDMGNVRSDGEFYEHFKFAAAEMFRILKPGRLMSFHCMNLPLSKERDGVIGIRDFRGEMIRLFQDAGFIFHSEVVIWKDPVTAMQRTKALGLLHKTIRKDSSMSRQGIPDYLVTMRKPGVNAEPIAHTPQEFPVDLWQRYASPVWMDINPSKTLQHRSAREEKDERHICPLQIEVIERAIDLWSNPGDLVFSPFMGIGSEGVVALEKGRRFCGAELKPSYFKQAVANLTIAEKQGPQLSIFEEIEELAVA